MQPAAKMVMSVIPIGPMTQPEEGRFRPSHGFLASENVGFVTRQTLHAKRRVLSGENQWPLAGKSKATLSAVTN